LHKSKKIYHKGHCDTKYRQVHEGIFKVFLCAPLCPSWFSFFCSGLSG
jgi:hypothetical protein